MRLVVGTDNKFKGRRVLAAATAAAIVLPGAALIAPSSAVAVAPQPRMFKLPNLKGLDGGHTKNKFILKHLVKPGKLSPTANYLKKNENNSLDQDAVDVFGEIPALVDQNLPCAGPFQMPTAGYSTWGASLIQNGNGVGQTGAEVHFVMDGEKNASKVYQDLSQALTGCVGNHSSTIQAFGSTLNVSITEQPGSVKQSIAVLIDANLTLSDQASSLLGQSSSIDLGTVQLEIEKVKNVISAVVLTTAQLPSLSLPSSISPISFSNYLSQHVKGLKGLVKDLPKVNLPKVKL